LVGGWVLAMSDNTRPGSLRSVINSHRFIRSPRHAKGTQGGYSFSTLIA
jgi:hypothetical protein